MSLLRRAELTPGLRNQDVGRVLVIGVNYAPEHSGIAPYTTALAEHLASTGRDVTVVTAMPHYPAWEVGEAYAGRRALTEAINGVQVIRHAIYIPKRQSAMRRLAYDMSFVASSLPVVSMRAPDVILGIIPGLSAGVLARVLAGRWRVPYGLVIQNLTALAVRHAGLGRRFALAGAAGRAERWALAKAAAVAVVSERFVPYLRNALAIPEQRVAYLPNWTHIGPARLSRQRIRAQLGWSEDEQIALHAGNIGLMQDLDQVVRAASLAASRGEPVRFVLMGQGSQRSRVESAARGLGNVTIVDPVPDEVFCDVLAAADALLVLERPNTSDFSLPSKLTSYAAAGRPIVAAATADSMTAELICAASMGIVVPPAEPDALLAALAALRRDTAIAAALGEAGRRYSASELNPMVAYHRIDQFVAKVESVRSDTALSAGRVASLTGRGGKTLTQ